MDEGTVDNPAINLESLQQQLTEQARKAAALHDILEAVSTPAEIPVMLKKSLNAALAAAQGDAGFIHLRDRSGLTMRLAAQQGISGALAASLSSISSNDGLVAWVARNNEPLLIKDVANDDRTTYLIASEDLRTYLGAPISRGDRVWGTLSIIGQDPSQFGDEEAALLVSVGEEIGIVVENARLRRQAERLLVVQERSRLARDLHDSVTQSLYSVTLFAEAGRRQAAAENNQEIEGYFSQIGETGQQALKEMRLLIHRLRPSILAKEGLVRALQHRLNSVEGRAGVKNRLIVEGEAKLRPSLEDALFQIAQEALNNALKHAMASEVVVRLDMTGADEVVIQIKDNGRGFDPAAAADMDGMGLSNIQERAANHDGAATIEAAPDQGCIVEARLKRNAKEAEQGNDYQAEELL